MNFNKKISTPLVGKYFVIGMMNMKSCVANLTLKNYPSVDIFEINLKMTIL